MNKNIPKKHHWHKTDTICFEGINPPFSSNRSMGYYYKSRSKTRKGRIEAKGTSNKEKERDYDLLAIINFMVI